MVTKTPMWRSGGSKCTISNRGLKLPAEPPITMMSRLATSIWEYSPIGVATGLTLRSSGQFTYPHLTLSEAFASTSTQRAMVELRPKACLDGTPCFLGAGHPDPHVRWRRVKESATRLSAMGG